MNKEYIANKILRLASITSEIDNSDYPNIDFKFTYAPYLESNVKGFVKGLNIYAVNVFDCLEYDCIQETGIWTSSVQDEDLPLKTVNNVQYRFVKGSLGKDGGLWNVDVGNICLITGQLTIFERYRPINERGYFSSLGTILPGLKVAILNRYVENTKQTIAVVFGDSLDNKNLIHSYPNFNLTFTANSKATYLEEISIGLINLITANYKIEDEFNTKYFIKGEFDPSLKKIINNNIEIILGLVDNTSTNNRFGSIPEQLAVYLKDPSELYGQTADNKRINPVRHLVAPGCIEVNCLEITQDALNTSRKVSNRAIAWFLYLLLVYEAAFQEEKYTSSINNLSDYLIRQIDSKTNLLAYGWNNTPVLANSTKIEDYYFSTSAITCLALGKAYLFNSNLVCLEKSIDIYESIFKYFYETNTGLFLTKLNSNTLDKDSIIHGIIFSILLNRQDVLAKSSSVLNNYVNLAYLYPHEEYELDSFGNYVLEPNGDYRYSITNRLSDANLSIHPEYLDFFKVSSTYTVPNFYTYNYLFCEAINYCIDTLGFYNSQIKSLLPIVNKYKEITLDKYYLNSLFTLSNQLQDSNFFSNDLFTSLPINEIEAGLFQRNLLINKLKSFIPTDYGWFSKEALERGNIGTLLKTFSKPFSTWYANLVNFKDSLFKSSAKGKALTNLLENTGHQRFNLTTDKEFREELINLKDSKNIIIDSLKRLEVVARIEEPYKLIGAFNSNDLEELYTSNTKNLYFGDSNYYNTNVIKLAVYQPINSIILREIEQSRRVGLNLQLEENVVIEEKGIINFDACINITIEECTIVTQENEIILTQSERALGCEEGVAPEGCTIITHLDEDLGSNQTDVLGCNE